MTENELIEKMARAISGAPFPSTRSYEKARAALAAIREAGCEVAPREPTEKMLEAAEDPLCGVACGDLALDIAGDVWHAMLSASFLKGET
jgi:hypothetical protein